VSSELGLAVLHWPMALPTCVDTATPMWQQRPISYKHLHLLDVREGAILMPNGMKFKNFEKMNILIID